MGAHCILLFTEHSYMCYSGKRYGSGVVNRNVETLFIPRFAQGLSWNCIVPNLARCPSSGVFETR